jgi:inosine-uridine nucleoside N-ribohydrolase
MLRKATLLLCLVVVNCFLFFPQMVMSSENRPSEKIKIIIDTDIGEDIDDILVIAFALNSPEFDVLAITTVDGNVATRSRISRALTKVYGRPEIPVAEGYVWEMPREDSPFRPGVGVTQGELAPTEEGLPPASLLKADELVARMADRYPGEVYYLAIGSYANVGQLLVRFPEKAKKLKAIVTSGVFMDPGSFTSGQKIPDWNFRYDPLAAAVIMRSEIPWVITPSTTAVSVSGISAEQVAHLIEEGLAAKTTNHAAAIPWSDVDRLRSAGLPTTSLLVSSIDLWKNNKPDAAPYPHIADLSPIIYLLGNLVTTFRADVHITVPPRGHLPEVRIQKNADGRAIIANEVPADLGKKLYSVFLDRLLALPIAERK